MGGIIFLTGFGLSALSEERRGSPVECDRKDQNADRVGNVAHPPRACHAWSTALGLGYTGRRDTGGAKMECIEFCLLEIWCRADAVHVG